MPPSVPTTTSSSKGGLTWRPTKIMNMRDLSKDDDFLSHLLVEKLGTGTVPLLVHKMDSSRKLPKTDAQDLLQIVRRLVVCKGPVQHATRQAVDELLLLPAIRYYLKMYTQKQINAFATHASRYFELYHPSGSIEIAHTSRYSHRTGKSELCILATRFLAPGTVITELKGSMANLTDEEDKELKRTDLRNSDIRRDFSVIHSKQMKKNHLFLGPARFVNHDCDNNCELFREGRYITFRVLRPVAVGEEITAHYGDGYFGRKNRHCLCETCEKLGRGGYAPDNAAGASQPAEATSDSDSDSDADSSSTNSEAEHGTGIDKATNLNERRTRRGVYAVVVKKDDDSDESEPEEDNTVPLANAKDIPTEGEMELDNLSELTSLDPSSTPAAATPSGQPTPTPASQRCSSLVSSLSSAGDPSMSDKARVSRSGQSTPARTIISTRAQKAKGTGATSSRATGQLATPPLSEEAESSNTPVKRVTRSTSSLALSASMDKGKGRASSSLRLSAPLSTASHKGKNKAGVSIKREEPEARVLRARPSAAANTVDPAKEPQAKPVVLRGPDGKPLPLCCTCSNVLPVISVDSKVVWGLGLENSKRKKNKQECPRCIRHFAIYAQPWPCRVPAAGSSFLPTPREEATPVEAVTRRVTQKGLLVLDRKLAAAASASTQGTKHKVHEKEVDERPKKRQKVESGPRVEMSAKAKKAMLLSKATKVVAEKEKRQRGRPRLSSPRESIVKVEDTPSAVPAESPVQPRNTHGRFEKKHSRDDLRSRNKATDAEADRQPNNSGSMPTRTSSRNRKRPHETDHVQLSDSPKKKAQKTADDEKSAPSQRVVPRPTSSFPGGKVFFPNPLAFALRAWANPVILDDSSSEDGDTPVTPEDGISPPPTDGISLEKKSPRNSTSAFRSGAAGLARGALTLKPSPFTFARRRWASASASPTGDVDAAHVDPEVEQSEQEQPGMSPPHDISRPRWAKETYSYLSNKPGLACISDVPVASGSADNTRSRGVVLLQHVYPALIAESGETYPTSAVSFAQGHADPPPSFVNAGWDSCSDTSEL